MPIYFNDLGSEGRDNLLGYLESKGFTVGPALREIYTHWSKEFIDQVWKELAIYAQRQPTGVLASDHQEILTYLTSWPNCPAGIEDQDIKKAENAFRAMAQQLRSFYGRQDQDDQVPFWIV